MRRTERVADILTCQREVSSAERTLTEASAKCLWEQIRRKRDVSSFIRGGCRYHDRSSDKLKWDRGLFRLRFCICKSGGFLFLLFYIVNRKRNHIIYIKGGSSMFNRLRYDIRAIRERDPAARSGVEVFLLYSGLHAVIWYRIAHWFFKHHLFFIARLLSQTAKWLTGIEIHPGATIGKGLLIDHGSGVVIGETAEIGDNCTIYQGVTLGGTGKDKGKRHPTLGDNVMVGSGAKILGPFKVGSNSKIAANAVVLEEIPENCTAVGVPARIVRRDGQKLCNDMDQVHIPDPVSQELCKLRQRIEHLENRLQEQQEEQNNA